MQGEASETPEKIVCEKCGAEMHIVRDSYQMGMKCPNCGWGWVTTYNEPIEVDYSVYHVVLDSKDGSLVNVHKGNRGLVRTLGVVGNAGQAPEVTGNGCFGGEADLFIAAFPKLFDGLNAHELAFF